MPPLRTYGSKRSASARATAAAMFGQAEEDLAYAVGSLSLQPEEEEELTLENASIIPVPASLLPLVTAYKTDIGRPLLVQDWNDILDDHADVTKIAEASYAEVYRVNTAAGSSILKVMRIRMEEQPESMRCYTASDVKAIISEIRIMNALTTVPGFVTYKDAHLVQGMIPPCITKAYRKHVKALKRDGGWSHFPVPHTLPEETIYLVIELGDAGDVLDEVGLDTKEQVWDVFIGVTIALARAEVTNEFEHRDLHENNICVKLGPKRPVGDDNHDDANGPKYGSTGWEITLIDYGLSRTQLPNGEIAFNNLEDDLRLFGSQGFGIARVQYETYRRMRTYLILGTRTVKQAGWQKDFRFRDVKTPRSWSEFLPYTNVLWLRYLLLMLIRKLKDKHPSLAKNVEAEAKELKRQFEPMTKVENGAFSTAQDVLVWLVGAGWVTEEQISGEDGTSFLTMGEPETEAEVEGDNASGDNAEENVEEDAEEDGEEDGEEDAEEDLYSAD
ncbi:uncharacterized protein LY89DRAFT_789946 [Mollisia scopiformis]|uniref:non-specific serine/threonine protein kinase n=1 Tax=Mollisia scopiformis TaxID=149040 RepID=A0A132B416_MOLSC|nr:uncharacterized protein LY89DRAFT_789946 [Mollisia scopiformis]KUJ07155.1 hypothetical protein LY89DRAFT_789946 [Mollisia scopiformis]